MPLKKDLILGRIVVERGFVTEKQLEECYAIQAAVTADPDSTSAGIVMRPLIGILLDKGFVSHEQAAGVLEEQQRRVKVIEDQARQARIELGLGQLLVKYNKATQLQINKCLEIQKKMEEQGRTPVPRLGELLMEHGFVDAKTIQEVLRIQQKEVLLCTNCGKQFNVIGVEPGKAYKCRECGGIMMTREMLDSVGAEETMHGFELPTADAPPPADS